MTATNASPTVSPTSKQERRRSMLDVVVLVALFTLVAADVVAQVLTGVFVLPVMIFGSIYLICGIVVATGWRWAMLFPLTLCPLGVTAHLASGFPEYFLSHPSGEYVAFVLSVIEVPLAAIAVGVSAVKLAQTLRQETFHAPRLLGPALGAAVGLIVGALLIGAIAQPSAGGGAAANAGTEVVHLTASRFAPDIVALHQGETLTVVDDGSILHSLTNGSWSPDNRPMSGRELGAPIVTNMQLNNNRATIGPFTTPGTYHIYCTLHPGMNLTVIVQ